MTPEPQHTLLPWYLTDGGGISAKWENGEEVQVCSMDHTRFWQHLDLDGVRNKRINEEVESTPVVIHFFFMFSEKSYTMFIRRIV